MTAEKRYAAGAASPQYAHTFGGGGPFSDPIMTNTVNRFEYSTETASAFPGGNLGYSGYQMGAISNTFEAFIQGLQYSPGPPYVRSNRSRLTFATDTIQNITGPGSLNISHPGDTGVANTPFK